MKSARELYALKEDPIVKGSEELFDALCYAWTDTRRLEASLRNVSDRARALVAKLEAIEQDGSSTPVALAVMAQHEVITALSNMSLEQLTGAAAKAESSQAAWNEAVAKFWQEI